MFNKWEVNLMAEMHIQIPVESIAGMIKKMDSNELETLCFLISDQDKEILERKRDIESEKVQLISREEVFDV